MGCILGHECSKYIMNMTCTLYIARLTAQCSSTPPELYEQCVCVCLCVCVYVCVCLCVCVCMCVCVCAGKLACMRAVNIQLERSG